MTDIQVLNFIVWAIGSIVISALIGTASLIPVLLSAYFNLKSLHPVILVLLLNPLVRVLAEVVILAFTVWVFTGVFLKDILLLYLGMNVLALLILLLLHRLSHLLSAQSAIELAVKSQWAWQHRLQSFGVLETGLLIAIGIASFAASIASLGFTFYVTVLASIDLNVLVRYLLLIAFATYTLSNINQLFARIFFLSGPRIDRSFRLHYLYLSFFDLYRFALGLYLILGALDIPLDQLVFIFGPVRVELLAVVILVVLTMFVVLVVLPYNRGETRRKKHRLNFVQRKVAIADEIERAADLTDIDKSARDLEVLEKRLIHEAEGLESEISENRESYDVGDRQKVKFFEPAPTRHIADSSTYGGRILKLARCKCKIFRALSKPRGYGLKRPRQGLGDDDDLHECRHSSRFLHFSVIAYTTISFTKELRRLPMSMRPQNNRITVCAASSKPN